MSPWGNEEEKDRMRRVAEEAHSEEPRPPGIWNDEIMIIILKVFVFILFSSPFLCLHK